jgi:hypothetical protein
VWARGLSMFGQSPLFFFCVAGYVNIHVWAKSAFVFLRVGARGLSMFGHSPLFFCCVSATFSSKRASPGLSMSHEVRLQYNPEVKEASKIGCLTMNNRQS